MASGNLLHSKGDQLLMLCEDLEGWDGEGGRGKLKREGIWGYMYTYS